MFNVNKTVGNGKAILAPEGKLDTLTAPEFDKVVKSVLPELTELVLDFEKLEYISSAGLRVLLSAQKVMNAQGKMKLLNVNEAVMEILDVTGFSEILTIE